MIGQAHVTEPLMTALRTARIGHAYLFSGPRGCGKTTSARILARCLNCAEGPTDAPCGVCPSCIELSRDGGGSLDVVEIDAASHGGVDDARELRERAVFAPARDRYKIFIIDEAHMVTSGGFNALLKIVEEPPPHVKFIFATTEPEKVIGTIRSRTHHYPFRLIAPAALIDYAQQLCDTEGVTVEPGVLPLVVRAGAGSVRDTLSILDQLIAGSEGPTVALERATGLLGYTSAELLDEVVEAFAGRDAAAAFAATDRVVQTGQDPRRFVEDLLERLRDLIVVTATSVQGASAVFRGVPLDQLQRMFEQSQGFAPGELSRVADAVSAALDSMAGATAPRLHLELLVARALAALQAQPQTQVQPQVQSQPQVQVQPQAQSQTQTQPQAQVQSQPSDRTQRPSVVQHAPAGEPAASAGQPEVDIVSTMRSARDFLRNDTAGSGAAASEGAVTGAGEAAGPGSDAATSAGTDTAADAGAATVVPGEAAEAARSVPAEVEAVGLGELKELWPEILDEILESDREAWNAVRVVQPLAFESELLTVGVSSRSDLDMFKTVGAGPLREAILAATGITVKYLPKPMPEGMRATEREAESDEEPSPTADPQLSNAVPLPTPRGEYGDPGFDPSGDPDHDAAYDPDLTGQADAEEQSAPEPEPAPEPVPAPEPAPELALQREPVSTPEREPVPEQERSSAHADSLDSERSQKPTPETPPKSTIEAATTLPPVQRRYGEAVVREVLGARFLEEHPFPSETEGEPT